MKILGIDLISIEIRPVVLASSMLALVSCGTQEQEPRTVAPSAYGVGAETCKWMLENYPNSDEARLKLISWVAGFISGSSEDFELPAAEASPNKVNFEELFLSDVESECRKHPSKRVIDVSRAIVKLRAHELAEDMIRP